MKVRIEIGELILEGFDYHDHIRIGNAVRQELVRLIRENGLPEGLALHARRLGVGAPSFHASPGMNPISIGRETARSIYRSLVSQGE
jgi:hypothetical protein